MNNTAKHNPWVIINFLASLIQFVDNNKYNWDDGTTSDLEFIFVINKAKIEKPRSVTKEYNGEEQILAQESNEYDLSNYKCIK